MTVFLILNGQNDGLMRFHNKVTEFQQECDTKFYNLMRNILKLKSLLLHYNK
jgi:hypothetical protein